MAWQNTENLYSSVLKKEMLTFCLEQKWIQ